MKEKTINNRRYRVTKKTTIWIPGVYFYYPEERYKWWPFWFKFIYSGGSHICFNSEKDAWKFIDNLNNP
jgi:hypothetical protein